MTMMMTMNTECAGSVPGTIALHPTSPGSKIFFFWGGGGGTLEGCTGAQIVLMAAILAEHCSCDHHKPCAADTPILPMGKQRHR